MQNFDEKVYKEIFHLLPDLVLITNKKGIIVYGNNQIVSWLGYDMDEIVGHSVLTLKFITPRSKIFMGKNFFRRIAGQEIEPYVIDFRAKNGDMKSGLVRGSIIKDENGKTLLNVSLVTNVTKETNKKRNLESTEKKYKYLFDNMVDGFTLNKLIKDESGNAEDFIFLEINNSFEEILGIEPQKIIDKKMTEVIPKDMKEVFDHIEIFSETVNKKEKKEIEVFSKKLDKWIKITSHSPADDQFVLFYQDISNKKNILIELEKQKSKMEKELKRLEDINKKMVDRELEMIKLKEKLKE